jgi:peptidoglycan-associated lipoprotein
MTHFSRITLSMAAVVVMGVMAVGCHGKKPQAAPPPPPPPPVVTPAPPPPPPPPQPRPAPAPQPPPAPLTEDQIFSGKTLDQLNAEKPLTDVFFDYDKSDLREEGRTALQRNADWLKKWTAVKVTVEGHCDSRGTAEYNLALGERRANVVKSYLVSLGVGADRVQVISKGKEQPFCTDENEGCWSQNRRGHFIVTAK